MATMLSLERRYLFATIAIIIGITAICYGRFIDNYFAYDDFAIMEHVIRGPAAVLQGYNYILRLVANAIHWPLYYGFGLKPLGYNLFCIGLNALNAIILFFLVRMLFGNHVLASLSAILFAASSVGCDAIFWKAAYATPLNLAFYMLTLIAYLRFRREGNQRYFYLSIVLFILAILSKEEAASLPFVILLIELLILKVPCDWSLVRKTIPYGVVIILYLLANYIMIYHIFKGESELVRHSSFRPLHTLFSSLTVFFLPPQGRLDGRVSAMVASGIFMVTALIFTRDRRLLLFAIGWVFVTFLPQSLSSLSQFEPKYIFNSISRHLYLPSAGAALVIAAVLVQLRDRFGPLLGRFVVAVAVTGLLYVNYERIQKRGSEWAVEGRPVKAFLAEIGKEIATFPENTHFYVEDAPTGRAYVQQAMRAYYRNATLWWIAEPDKYMIKPNEPVFLISCFWRSRDEVKLQIKRLN
jgi:hypothetical protein